MYKLNKKIKSNINLNGYIIKLNNINTIIKGKIYTDLSIFPNNNYNNKDIILPYFLYKENNNNIILPLYYGINNFGINKIEYIPKKKINIQFNNILRDYQYNIINNIKKYYYNDNDKYKIFGGGIRSIPPGYGKTILAIYIACMLNVKTLVVVHKSFLIKQWIDKIKEFTNARIGIIRQKTINIHNKDIVIGMIHSIAMKDYDLNIFKDFGLVIFDECHHLSAKTFSKAMMKLRIPYTLGLSATLERKDNLENIIEYFLGPVMYKSNITYDNLNVNIYNYDLDNYEKNRIININENNIQYKYDIKISILASFKKRNLLISNIINNLIKIDDNRKILLLSSRSNKINQLQLIKDELIKLDKKYEDNIGFYTGKTSDLERKLSETKQLIFATYELANEGLDIPDLNTLIFALPPKGNLDQCIGRILRKKNNEPIVIDIIDNYDIFKFLGINRIKNYKQKGNIIDYYG